MAIYKAKSLFPQTYDLVVKWWCEEDFFIPICGICQRTMLWFWWPFLLPWLGINNLELLLWGIANKKVLETFIRDYSPNCTTKLKSSDWFLKVSHIKFVHKSIETSRVHFVFIDKDQITNSLIMCFWVFSNQCSFIIVPINRVYFISTNKLNFFWKWV